MDRKRRKRKGMACPAPAPRAFVVGTALVAAVGFGAPVAAQAVAGSTSCPAPSPDAPPDGLLADVRYLSDDALEGRAVGTPGARCAADWLARRFAELGLRGAGPGGSFFQPFTVRTGTRVGSGSRLSVSGQAYTPAEDWIPYGFSAAGEARGRPVPVPGDASGHGSAHAGLRDRIVLVEARGHGTIPDVHAQAAAAARLGASGLVVLLPDGAPLPDPSSELRPAVPVPTAAARGPVAAALRRAAEEGATVILVTDVRAAEGEARNVAALLPGADPASRLEVVILGAHYDHLGLGGDGSLAPDEVGTVHNGADDNASGSAALVEVARRLVEAGEPPARSVLFLAFTGEERGLWGSGHYVSEPLVPLERTVAMLNMDMVGRLGDAALTVFGTGTAEEWAEVLERADSRLEPPLGISRVEDGYGPSDHSAFYGEGIPVLHFFTNTHEDYHRPTDDWQKIDVEGLERVAGLVTEVARILAGTGGAALALTPVEGAGSPHGAARPGDGDPAPGQGYGPYLGTIPDMTPRDHGVRITGVRSGSPAEAAGLRGGDVIVRFAGREVTDLYAYTYALRDQAPGDRVEIEVLRDGERVTLTAVLGERR